LTFDFLSGIELSHCYLKNALKIAKELRAQANSDEAADRQVKVRAGGWGEV